MDTRFLAIAELDDVPSVAVVVDVMRAFTVAAWAFARGAEKIVLAESLDEALALKARHPGWVALKDGPPAPGFDAVNSPGMLRSVDLGGRTVVQKTTAGTVGALAVKEASLVLCAGFVVAEATARLLRIRAADQVTFVVTGEDGRADEDLACAQYIARRATEADTDADAFLRRSRRVARRRRTGAGCASRSPSRRRGALSRAGPVPLRHGGDPGRPAHGPPPVRRSFTERLSSSATARSAR